jgi:dephospho-CoA kinase
VTIILLVGSPASGKSTTAEALAARFSKSMVIDVDVIRERFVRTGQALPAPV